MGGNTLLKITVNEDIELKILEEIDSESLFSLTDSCRQYLREWLPWLDGIQHKEHTRSFIEAIQKQYTDNIGLHMGIWYNNQLIGVVGLLFIDHVNRCTSIGYWLANRYQGKGIITRSCGALINYAFTKLNLNRVEIRCAVENHKSRGIPNRLGFQNEGVVREAEWLYDHYVNHVIYGLIKSEWGIPRPLL